MTKNLVNELGTGYFIDRYSDKIFVQGDVAYQPRTCTSRGVECAAIVSRTDPSVNAKWRSGDVVSAAFPNATFKDFDVFAYPEMGYRNINGGAYLLSRDVRRVYSSGFSLTQMRMRSSALTSLLETLMLRPAQHDTTHDYLSAALWPVYDTKADLPALFDGKRAVVVLSRRVLIEPSVRNTYDLYDVWVDGLRVGSLTPNGEVSKNTPPANRQLLDKVLE